MEYRRAGINDIEKFVEHRIRFVTSIRSIEDVALFRERTRAYIAEHIDKQDLLVFLAVEGDEIVSSCMACIFETAPLPSNLSGKSAELLNVFTVEGHRRKGHAEKLLHMMLGEAKRCSVSKIVLSYTEDGRGLYEKLGFTHLDKQMTIRL